MAIYGKNLHGLSGYQRKMLKAKFTLFKAWFAFAKAVIAMNGLSFVALACLPHWLRHCLAHLLQVYRFVVHCNCVCRLLSPREISRPV